MDFTIRYILWYYSQLVVLFNTVSVICLFLNMKENKGYFTLPDFTLNTAQDGEQRSVIQLVVLI